MTGTLLEQTATFVHKFSDKLIAIFGTIILFSYFCLLIYGWTFAKDVEYDEFTDFSPNYKFDGSNNEGAVAPKKFNLILRDEFESNNKTCATFNAFIYPLTQNASMQAQRLHTQLLNSNYAINNKLNSTACIFVAVIDTPDELNSLEFLNGNEHRHVVYLLNGTLEENSKVEHYFGNDVFGQNGLFLNVPDNIEKETLPTHRITLQVHTDQTQSNNLIHGCEIKTNNKGTKCFYTDLLEDITDVSAHFIYIGYKNARKFNSAFYSALVSGSIPVISGYDFRRLPLSDLISWNSAVVRVPTNQIEHMLNYLQEFDNDQIIEMRRRGQHFFSKNYFVDSKALIRSTLSAVRYRMQVSAPFEHIEETRLARNSIWPVKYIPKEPVNTQKQWMALQNAHFVFNSDPTFLDSYSPYDRLWQANEHKISPRALNSHLESAKSGMNYAFSLSGNVPDEEFTIVLMAYKRDKQVRHVLQKLDGIRFLRQIIVLWVDTKRKPPPSEFWPQIHVPIHFVLAENRSLNVRFLPFDLIETEAVFSMDDDFEADNELIEFSFRVWRENRDVLVGPNERLGYTDPLTKQGVYKSEIECHYNLILTSGAFLHRNYLKAYWTSQPAAVRDWIDQNTNCEDVAMNFLVSHLSRKASIKTTPILYTKGTFVERVRLSKRPEHLRDRAKCVQVFEEIYGYNPLLLSEYRADSVHYQHEQQYQCFKGT